MVTTITSIVIIVKAYQTIENYNKAHEYIQSKPSGIVIKENSIGKEGIVFTEENIDYEGE